MELIPQAYDYKKRLGVYQIKSGNVKSDFDLKLVECVDDDNPDVVIKCDKSLDKEEYVVDIDSTGIKVSASSKTGAYYALQSLRILSDYDLGGDKLNYCHLHDKPDYGWRGLHLDESRHFFGMDEVKRLLDLMFMMKLNVFHWHLTDDQGWRIEIKKYPLLTEIGSKRKNTYINGWGCDDVINKPYEGYYTQEQIKEIVSYAKERGIMIVPEIDMPAHFAAAMAAYPELGCREIKTEVPGYFGGKVPLAQGVKDWNRSACVGKQTTFDFIYAVIDEICELFDAPYFHIGGDEAPKDEWKKCPKCQKVIKDNNLKNVEELQGWFNNRICKYVEQKGKRLIGWNEILAAGNLDKSVIAQYWVPARDKNVERYVQNGGSIIMSKHQSFYFDMNYSQYPLKNTYNYSPSKYGIKPQYKKNIIGVEGEVWTEWIDGRAKLDLNVFPRLQALAEAAWTPQEMKDYKSFCRRLEEFKKVLDKLQVGYAVKKISNPKSPIFRIKAEKLFHCGDTHYELKFNDAYRLKGEK